MENNFTLAAPNLVVQASCEAYACLAESYTCQATLANDGNFTAKNVIMTMPIPASTTLDPSTLPANCTTDGAVAMTDNLFA